jgi:hypothetical protein
MSKPNQLYWGNLPQQSAAPEFLSFIQRQYPDLSTPIKQSLQITHEQVGPDIPLNINGTIVTLRRVQGIWKLYGPSIPECRIKSMLNTLHSAISTCLQIR